MVVPYIWTRTWRKAVLAVLLLLALFGAMLVLQSSSTEGAPGDKIYWATGPTIFRANLDGTEVEEVLDGVSVQDITIDSAGGKMYWTNPIAQKIQRANLDGTGLEDLAATSDVPYGIDIDHVSGKVYWADFGLQKIMRANLDGTSIETVLAGPTVGYGEPTGLAVDGVAGRLYWAGSTGSGNIYRANIDGSGNQLIASPFSVGVFDMALDLTAGKLYSTHQFPCGFLGTTCGKIVRHNLGGSGEVTVDTNRHALGIDVDSSTGDFYWAQVEFFQVFKDPGVPRVMKNGAELIDSPAVSVALFFEDAPPLPTPTTGPLAVGGVARGTGLAPLPAAEEAAGSATPWIAGAALAGIAAALGGVWYARRRLVGQR